MQDPAGSFDDDVDRSHARLHPEGGVDVGDKPRTRDGQSEDRGCFLCLQDCGGRTARPCRRNPRLPVDQHHAPGLMNPLAPQPVEVDPGGHGAPRGIGGVPTSRVKAGRPLPVDKGRHPLSQDVEDLEPHPGRGRELVGDDGGRIERIGIVMSQLEPLGQSRHASAQPTERQSEVARLVGRRLCRLKAQVGQVEQQHLRPGHGFPRGHPQPALDQGLGPCLQARQQPHETADCIFHLVYPIGRYAP